ncbi:MULTISPECIES: hypothetical protein [Alteromonas]|jgi:hypothetical protein|uniref:Uncharacterized protein n=1 Tax=Alteromonas macleodii TaxID=28108 RepID=A0AB36FKD5_ALTMA|nr:MULTISPECIES: hypothetical protein [Alteromonas]MCG7639311.1 hypothetical protein [Alteromonas sp. CNT1-28]OES23837.1 hypothetical protein BFV95_4922 [Alteromonas macleodii]OES24543.1 hypothetical protein BFV94_4694 [Alteromonas macleodii]OES38499.1 hypothetical protein BFV96_4910 [Alteromonas macleodii]
MSIFGSVILPKLAELSATPPFIKTLYQVTQSNKTIDPLWEGVAVVFNEGTERYLNSEKSNSSWIRLRSEYTKAGGLDGRVGVITQYNDLEQVSFMNSLYSLDYAPWVRVSSFIDCHSSDKSYPICHSSSISLDARYVTTIPTSLFIQAKETVVERDIAFTSMIEKFLREPICESY